MDKGKKPQSSSYKKANIGYNSYGSYDVDEVNARIKKIIKPEQVAREKKEYEKKVFLGSMRRMISRRERKGKDWVETKEEFLDFGWFDLELIDNVSAVEDKLKKDLEDRKISEEEYHGHLEELNVYYEAKKEELLAAEDVRMMKYVKRYEERHGNICPESWTNEKEIEEAEDENYALDLSQF